MHKKRISNKNYFYTTVRNADKTRTIYLGSNQKDAKLKEKSLWVASSAKSKTNSTKKPTKELSSLFPKFNPQKHIHPFNLRGYIPALLILLFGFGMVFISQYIGYTVVEGGLPQPIHKHLDIGWGRP